MAQKWNETIQWGRRKWSKNRISRSYYCTEHAVRHNCMWLHLSKQLIYWCLRTPPQWKRMADQEIFLLSWIFVEKHVGQKRQKLSNSHFTKISDRWSIWSHLLLHCMSASSCWLLQLEFPILLFFFFLNESFGTLCVQRIRGHNQSSFIRTVRQNYDKRDDTLNVAVHNWNIKRNYILYQLRLRQPSWAPGIRRTTV